jgi:hypothetical protein
LHRALRNHSAQFDFLAFDIFGSHDYAASKLKV